MKFEDYRKIEGNRNGKAIELLERVCKAAEAREIVFAGIEYRHIAAEFGRINVGDKYFACNTVFHHNGADEDVSVDLCIFLKDGKSSSRRLAKVRVPNNASDNVINKRLTAIVEQM